SLFLSIVRRQPRSPLFPYTTLFRSESRGVAIGDGKVYLGKLDGSLVALDQKSGKEVWKTQVAPWQRGYSITAAPLYVDGMVIVRSEEHTSELQSRSDLVCRLLLEKK